MAGKFFARLHRKTAVALLAATACALAFTAGDAMAQTGGSLVSADATFHGNVNDQAAKSLAGAGDVNGDGFDDLVVGAPFNDLGPGSDGGAAFLVRGGPGGWGAETFLQQSSIIAYTGEADSDNAGTSVASAGDFNADGFDDLVVGAPLEGAGDAGAAYVVLGSATPTSGSVPPAAGSLGSPEHIELTGEVAGDQAGKAVAGAGDVNGDGFDDVVVGAPLNDDAGAGAGAAYLVLGSATPTDGSLGALGIEYTGEATVIDDNAGTSVAGGDFDGDGDSDLIIGAPGNDDGTGNNAGAAYIVAGATAGLPAPGTSTSLGIGTPTVVQLSGEFDGDAAGTSVALGDVNGDGRADALVGAPLSDAGGALGSNTGAAYVVPGKAGMPNNALGLVAVRLNGETADDQAGTSVAALGDVDGDSFGDLAVGAPLQGSVDKGAAYFVRGTAFGFNSTGPLASHTKYVGAQNNDKAGTSVAGAGDLNGDALADFLVGAPENDTLFSNGGAAYAVFAPAPRSSSPSYRTRVALINNPGNALPARFEQARAVVDFTTNAIEDGSVDVTRHLFDPCDTSVRSVRPIWDIDSNKLSASTLSLTFKYTDAEVAASEEGELLVWKRPLGNPCGAWTQIPLANTQRDAAHNRIIVTGQTSLGSFTLAPESDPLPDTTPPETQIDSGPTGTTNDPTPTFAFSASEGGSTFVCRIDGGPFAGCTSPHTTASLADGIHTFEVRATDSAGNTDPSPAARTFTVDTTPPPGDTTPPETQIDSGPTGTTNDPTPTFEFSASEGGSTFECRIDGGPFVGCTSPHTTASLPDGIHTFEVRATDSAGNTDPHPAARSFTVDTTPPPGDTTPPETQIDSGPTGTSGDPTPTFEFSASEGGSTFECRIDGGPFVGCTSPHTTASLPDGIHTFEVRATDSAGNTDPSPAARTFTVDTTGPPPPGSDFPETAITAGPTGTTNDETPVFEFTSDELGATFECRLDAFLEREFAPCESPHPAGLVADGPHAFEVRAIDVDGFVDATPAVAVFAVATTGCRGEVATIVGTEGPDRIIGTDGDDVIVTFAGDDRVSGADGNDRICSGGDDDIVVGGLGADQIVSGSGDDVVGGDEEADFVFGGGGEDTVNGEDGDDEVRGGAGDDTVTGGIDADTLRGGSDDDTLNGGDGTDALHGGSGEDNMSGDAGDDVLRGNSADDVLGGATGDDDLFGNSGDDTVRGSGGADELFGGSGDDDLRGENDGDTLSGGGDDDALDGGSATDTCDGGSGDNSLALCE